MFLFTVIIGFSLIIFGCNNNVNELVTKKVIILIQ